MDVDNNEESYQKKKILLNQLTINSIKQDLFVFNISIILDIGLLTFLPIIFGNLLNYFTLLNNIVILLIVWNLIRSQNQDNILTFNSIRDHLLKFLSFSILLNIIDEDYIYVTKVSIYSSEIFPESVSNTYGYCFGIILMLILSLMKTIPLIRTFFSIRNYMEALNKVRESESSYKVPSNEKVEIVEISSNIESKF